MYSNEDLERFYFQYQTETLPHGVSIQDFCVRNKVPYNLFSKWYKDTRKSIVEVKVDGRPQEDANSQTVSPSLPSGSASSGFPLRILVEIRMSNGLHISPRRT